MCHVIQLNFFPSSTHHIPHTGTDKTQAMSAKYLSRNKICKTGNKNLIFLADRSICWLLSLNFCLASFWSRYSVNIWNQVLVLLSLLYCQTYGCSIYNQGSCFWGLGKQWFCFGKTAVMGKLQKEKKKIAACNSNLCCSPKQTEVSAGC